MKFVDLPVNDRPGGQSSSSFPWCSWERRRLAAGWWPAGGARPSEDGCRRPAQLVNTRRRVGDSRKESISAASFCRSGFLCQSCHCPRDSQVLITR